MSNQAYTISLPVDTGFVVLNYDDIVYIKADGNYCRVFLADEKQLMITRQLKAFEHVLPDKLFIRIHNQYIINKSFAKAFNKKDSQIILSPTLRLPVSVRRKKDVFEAFNLMG